MPVASRRGQILCLQMPAAHPQAGQSGTAVQGAHTRDPGWMLGSAGSVIPMENAHGEEDGVGGLAGLGGDMLQWGVA